MDVQDAKTQRVMNDGAACRAVLAKHLLDDPGAHGWMVTWGNANKGSRHGVMTKAGK